MGAGLWLFLAAVVAMLAIRLLSRSSSRSPLSLDFEVAAPGGSQAPDAAIPEDHRGVPSRLAWKPTDARDSGHEVTAATNDGLTTRLVVQAVISFAVLGAALWIILGRGSDQDSAKWAFGAVGTIVGYWLK